MPKSSRGKDKLKKKSGRLLKQKPIQYNLYGEIEAVFGFDLQNLTPEQQTRVDELTEKLKDKIIIGV